MKRAAISWSLGLDAVDRGDGLDDVVRDRDERQAVALGPAWKFIWFWLRTAAPVFTSMPNQRAGRPGTETTGDVGVAGRAGGDVDAEFLLGLAIADGETALDRVVLVHELRQASRSRSGSLRNAWWAAERSSRSLPSSGAELWPCDWAIASKVPATGTGRIPQLRIQAAAASTPAGSRVAQPARPGVRSCAREARPAEPRAHRRR